MGTTSEKLTYLNETKSQLKETINYAGAELTDDTFRQYPKKLYDKYIDIINNGTDALYNNLPKVTSSGTSVSLNGTASTRMKMGLVPSELEQATTTGKNLFSGNYSQFDSQGGTGNLYGYFKLPDDNKKYTLSMTAKNNYSGIANTFIGFTANGGDAQNGFEWLVTSTTSATKGQVLTLSNSTNNYRYISIYANNGSTITNLTDNFYIQLEEGVTATTYEPYTGGIASPNPDYPQDIHTISGDNNVYVNTKNLGYEGWAEDFVNRINNDTRAKLETVDDRNCLFYNANAGYQEYDTKYMFKTNFKENTRYTFKFMVKVNTNYQINLALNYTDGTYEQISYNQVANIWSTALFTSASGKTIKYLRAAYYSGNCYIDLDTFQVKEGTTVGDYEKGYQQLLPLTLGTLEYCKIGNYADEFMIPDKQLLDVSSLAQGGINTSYEEITSSYTVRTGFIKVSSNISYSTTYNGTGNYIVRIFEYDSNKTGLLRTEKTNTASATIDLLSNTQYIRLAIYSDSSPTPSTFTNIFKDFMLNKGSTALPYEPYNDGKWYLKKNINKMILNGTESWNSYSTYQVCYLTFPETFPSGVAVKYTYCDKLQSENATTAAVQINARPNNSVFARGGTPSLCFKTDYGNNTTNFTQWLSNNNITLYVVNLQPQYTLLNDTLQTQLDNIYNKALSYQDQTNISQVNDDLPFVISATCVKSTNSAFE